MVGCNSTQPPDKVSKEQETDNPTGAQRPTSADGVSSVHEPENATLYETTGRSTLESAKIVSLVQLDKSTNGQWFYYLGSNDKWHYFQTDETYYRIDKTEPIPPSPPENGGNNTIGNVALPMAFQDGKLTARYPTDEFPTGRFRLRPGRQHE